MPKRCGHVLHTWADIITTSLCEHWVTRTAYAHCCRTRCHPAVVSVTLIDFISKGDAIAHKLRRLHTWTDSGDGASSVSGSAGVPKPARRIKLPKVMYGTKVAPVALPSNTKPGAPMAPNLPACNVHYFLTSWRPLLRQLSESR